jgi:predicted PurR-regulated permease PerM
MLTTIIVLVAPIYFVIDITIRQAVQFSEDVSQLIEGKNLSLSGILEEVNQTLDKIPYREHKPVTEQDVIDNVQNIAQTVAGFLANRAIEAGSSTAELIPKLIIFLTLIATLFPAYPTMIQLLKDLSPLDDALDQKYLDRMLMMTKSMVKGVFIIAIVQGVSAGILYWIAGVKYVFFWTLLAIFFSIIPVGAHIISIPMGIILLINGQVWQGLLVIIGSLLFVGNIDNFLRPKLVPKETELNSALILLSALGGLNLFGFLGVIYGPVIMIFLVTTIEIYLENFRGISKR